MILANGPTGSGKTTTLYTILKQLNKSDISIITIEDPIEYSLDGTTQIQTNAEIGLTFANGLRSILRQDPNIIMVGEIRDEETASIAVNAALTGHLVLFDAPHERCGDDVPAPARYGRAAVPRRVDRERRDRPTARQDALPEVQSGTDAFSGRNKKLAGGHSRVYAGT